VKHPRIGERFFEQRQLGRGAEVADGESGKAPGCGSDRGSCKKGGAPA
jgi:hypothetical protein